MTAHSTNSQLMHVASVFPFWYVSLTPTSPRQQVSRERSSSLEPVVQRLGTLFVSKHIDNLRDSAKCGNLATDLAISHSKTTRAWVFSLSAVLLIPNEHHFWIIYAGLISEPLTVFPEAQFHEAKEMAM